MGVYRRSRYKDAHNLTITNYNNRYMGVVSGCGLVRPLSFKVMMIGLVGPCLFFTPK